MSTVVEAQKAWKLPAADGWAGWRPLWWTVGHAGELAVLLVHRRHLRRSPYIKGWVGRGTEVPFDGLLVIRRSDGSVERRMVMDVRQRVSHIALLPDARLLLVRGRADTDGTGLWLPNAVVRSPEGDEESAFCIGDDIPVLMTDRDGAIWTAYGDEGTCGAHPQSVAGLAGWSADGQVTWAPRGRLPDMPLEGCTAATDEDRVWLAWYGGSSRGGTHLTRITPSTGEVISRRSPVRDPDGFAVRGDRAVLTRRDHNRRSTEVVRARLIGDAWTVTDRRKIRVPGRVVKYCGQGRDGTLWLRAGDTWLRIEA
ncbi:hypothetical protein [Kitasatospora sp. NPDC093558]|uniref:hypothetical protein n=1 Tax=Kitasatospora sp. NPDC093558 TaxID=3155201 RepID=UPI00344066E1